MNSEFVMVRFTGNKANRAVDCGRAMAMTLEDAIEKLIGRAALRAKKWTACGDLYIRFRDSADDLHIYDVDACRQNARNARREEAEICAGEAAWEEQQ